MSPLPIYALLLSDGMQRKSESLHAHWMKTPGKEVYFYIHQGGEIIGYSSQPEVVQLRLGHHESPICLLTLWDQQLVAPPGSTNSFPTRFTKPKNLEILVRYPNPRE